MIAFTKAPLRSAFFNLSSSSHPLKKTIPLPHTTSSMHHIVDTFSAPHFLTKSSASHNGLAIPLPPKTTITAPAQISYTEQRTPQMPKGQRSTSLVNVPIFHA